MGDKLVGDNSVGRIVNIVDMYYAVLDSLGLGGGMSEELVMIEMLGPTMGIDGECFRDSHGEDYYGMLVSGGYH